MVVGPLQLDDHVPVSCVLTHAIDETASRYGLTGKRLKIDGSSILDIDCLGGGGLYPSPLTLIYSTSSRDNLAPRLPHDLR